MAAPGVAVPGSVVAIGSQASPAGPQGIQGPALVSAFVTKTAAYTLVTADSGKYFICSGGSWTLTLPAPAAGLVFQVRNDMGISGTTGTITLSPTGGTIDGASSIALLPQQECTLITDGSNWRSYGLKREVILGTLDITSAVAVSPTVLLPLGYRLFELDFSGLLPSANRSSLVGQVSVDGGTTWISTGHYDGMVFNNAATTVAFATNANALTYFSLGGPNNSAGPYGGQIHTRLYPGTGAKPPSWISNSEGYDTTIGISQWRPVGMIAAAQSGPVNAFKFFYNSGNIATAFLTVKGIS